MKLTVSLRTNKLFTCTIRQQSYLEEKILGGNAKAACDLLLYSKYLIRLTGFKGKYKVHKCGLKLCILCVWKIRVFFEKTSTVSSQFGENNFSI